MNTLDIFVLATVALAAIAGFRLGFVSRVLSWIGLGVGLWLGSRIVRLLLPHVAIGSQTTLLGITITALVVPGLLGQWLGFVLGRSIPIPPIVVFRAIDRVLGACLAAAGVMALLWLSLPTLLGAPGTMSSLASSSLISQQLDDHLPAAPDVVYAIRNALATDSFPDVFAALRPTPLVPAPPASSGLSATLVERVAKSVVKIEGESCRRIQDGTGFVASVDTIVTNAHVVAGDREVSVIRDDGRHFSGRVAAFDPENDLAVLAVSGFDRPPLPLGPDVTPTGSVGGVFGHPGGEPLRIAPFAVARTLTAEGLDIYGTSPTSRRVLELGASLRKGDSGSALISPSGEVVGVAFAISRDRPDVAYALAASEVRALLSSTNNAAISTGPCLGG